MYGYICSTWDMSSLFPASYIHIAFVLILMAKRLRGSSFCTAPFSADIFVCRNSDEWWRRFVRKKKIKNEKNALAMIFEEHCIVGEHSRVEGRVPKMSNNYAKYRTNIICNMLAIYSKTLCLENKLLNYTTKPRASDPQHSTLVFDLASKRNPTRKSI